MTEMRGCIVYKSYFKTNKLTFSLKRVSSEMEVLNHILYILHGFIFQMDILCKVFFPRLVLRPLDITFLAGLERIVTLSLHLQ